MAPRQTGANPRRARWLIGSVAVVLLRGGVSLATECDQLRAVERRIAALEERVQLATEEIDRAEQRVSEARAATAASPAQANAVEVDRAKAAVAVAEQALRAARADIDQLRAEGSGVGVAEAEAQLTRARDDRDAARARYEAARAVRERVREDDEIALLEERIEGAVKTLSTLVGPSRVGDLQRLSGELGGEAFSGDPGSRLEMVRRNQERYLDGTMGNYDRREHAAAEAKVKEVVHEAESTIDVIVSARKQLVQAEHRASAGWTPEERQALSELGSRRSAFEQADALFLQAQEQRDTAVRHRDQARSRRAELDGRLPELEARLSEAHAEVARVAQVRSHEEVALEEASKALAAAETEKAASEADLELARSKLNDAIRAVDAIEAEIEARVAQGKNAGSAAFAARKSGDRSGCSDSLAAAARHFEVALSLVRANGACITSADRKVAVITDYIQKASSIHCGGSPPPVPPMDGLVAVPDVIDMDVDAATAAVTAAGLAANAYAYMLAPSPGQQGKVVSQRPAAPQRVAAGTTVNLAYYARRREVPRVRGMGYEEADAALGFVGLFGQPRPGDPTSDTRQVGKVYDVIPAEGTAVEPGATVVITYHTDASGRTDSRQGSGFTAASSVTTRPTAGNGPPASGASASAVAVEHPFERNAKAAWARCDLDRAIADANILASEDPTNAWLAGAFQQIQADAAKKRTAEELMRQARAYLSSAEPGPADIQAAADLARQAQSTAPPCMSQAVSGLTGPIQSAQIAARARDRAATASAASGFISALTGALAVATNVVAGAGHKAPGMSASDLPSAAAVLTGVSIPGGGAAGGGGVAGGGTGSQSAAACDQCVISDYGQMRGQGPVNYVFELRRSFPGSGGCATASVRAYYLFSVSPTDSSGRPVSYWPEAAAAQSALGPGTTTICGPCGSYAQAAARVRSHCPTPAVSAERMKSAFPNVFRGGGQ